MAIKIKWVSGNTRPFLFFTVYDRSKGEYYDPDTWPVMDLQSEGVTAVKMQFRKVGDPAVITTLNGALIDDGINGVVQFEMDTLAADNPAGRYEGEIDLEYGSDTSVMTVYDTVQFTFRDGF